MAEPTPAPPVAPPSNGWQTVRQVARDLGTDAASLTRLKAIAGVVTSVAYAPNHSPIEAFYLFPGLTLMGPILPVRAARRVSAHWPESGASAGRSQKD